MRVSIILGLLAALLAAAPGDLRPRDGSGWRGFGEGTWVKVKKIDATTSGGLIMRSPGWHGLEAGTIGLREIL